MTALTTGRLGELEAVIERGLTTFVDVGLALMEIREQKLYRESHKTFESYCRERWGWSKTHANRHIQAAEVAGHLTPTGVIPPRERVVRELAPLVDTPDVMREVWFETVEEHGPAPTAAEVREVVGRKTAPRSTETPLDHAVHHFVTFLAEQVEEEIGELIASRKDLSPSQVHDVQKAVERMTVSLNGWRKR